MATTSNLVWQPTVEHMPESLMSFECYRSLANAKSEHPGVPEDAWRQFPEADIEDPSVLDESASEPAP